MSKFSFEIARHSDDADIQELLESMPMDGIIRVVFRRRPSYFYGANIGNKFSQTIVIRDTENGGIAGLGNRSIMQVYVNGEIMNVGYLSGLRIHKSCRNRMLLARGYRYLKVLHLDNKAHIYLTTIIEDNKQALDLLTSKRAGIPAYHDRGTYITIAIKVGRDKMKVDSRINVIRGTENYIEQIIDCLNRNGRKKQFFPYYTKEDFEPDKSTFRDFKLEDFYIAMKNNKAIGVLAKYDQNNFKQIVITGYSKKAALVKPLYNLYCRFRHFPVLPGVGSRLNSFYVSFIAIDENDAQVFQALLAALYNDAIGSSYSYILAGLHSQDSLLNVFQEYPHIQYKSRLFIACWDDGEPLCSQIDNRVPYLELGLL